MQTEQGAAHPLAGGNRRQRRLAILFEAVLIVVMAATVGTSALSDTWSWWYVLPISIVAVLGVVFQLLAVSAFNLDDTYQPITGRDADQFARWKLDQHSHRE
jgi:membrane protein YdbS with pleckstrin-like domain